ncbi:MAG: hypothetical protein GY828_03565 [Candidatus Gracilibacteria bacterium]|nr:hypothetical protein [Candidatus Gracilibacteria bacterium]
MNKIPEPNHSFKIKNTEQLIYKRMGVEIIMDVTDLNAKEYLGQSIEIMRMLGFGVDNIKKALDEITF